MITLDFNERFNIPVNSTGILFNELHLKVIALTCSCISECLLGITLPHAALATYFLQPQPYRGFRLWLLLKLFVTRGSWIIKNMLCPGLSSTLLESNHLEVSLGSSCVTWIFPAFWNDLFHCLGGFWVLGAGTVQGVTAAVAVQRGGHVRGLLRGFPWSRRQGHGQRDIHHVEHIAQTSGHL